MLAPTEQPFQRELFFAAVKNLQPVVVGMDGDPLAGQLGIPAIPDTDSSSFRTPVPVHCGQRFQFIPDTPSGGQHG